MQFPYKKDQTYVNKENISYVITGIWWLGFNPVKIEIMRTGGKVEHIYTIKEFETAIENGNLKLKT